MVEKRLRKSSTVRSEDMAIILERASEEIRDSIQSQLFEIWKLPDEYSEIRDKLLSDSYKIFRTDHSILEYVRKIAGKYRLSEGSVDITSELEKLCADIRFASNEKKIRFSSKLPTERVFTSCDIEKFSVSVLALALNAISYGGEDNRILVKMINMERLIKITIKDKGRGMSEEVLKRCTNPFFSYNPGGKQKQGLGMTLARHFAVASGGRLVIKSKEGVGTEVTMVLPKGGKMGTEAKMPQELMDVGWDSARIFLSSLD